MITINIMQKIKAQEDNGEQFAKPGNLRIKISSMNKEKEYA